MFDFVVAMVEKGGYAAVFGLMLAENLFPPFPSEVISLVPRSAQRSGPVALAGAGHLLEDHYERVDSYVTPVANLVLAAIAVAYLYRVATFERRNHA